jgi:hypothetical protein
MQLRRRSPDAGQGLLAVLATAGLLTVFGGAVMALPASPAFAVTCPNGSTTFNTENETGYQIVQNSNNDPGSPNADTCFSFDAGTPGQMTVTQADPADHVNPTSYPANGVGCGKTYCGTSWNSVVWRNSSLKISATMNPNMVVANSKYDALLDSMFTNSTGTFGAPNAEVEIVTRAFPSYTGLGFCAATSCGATKEVINGNTWWLKYKQATNGTDVWDDYIFVRDTMVSSVTNINLNAFWTIADNFSGPGHGGGLDSWRNGRAEFGTELWENGVNLRESSFSATNLP